MRVFLPKNEQKKLISNILVRISVKEAAQLCNLSERTIRDWRRAKFTMDLKSLRQLCRKTKVTIPANAKFKKKYWYTEKGSSAGGLAVFKKYGRIGGDPEYRKKKWYEWWNCRGRFNHPLIKSALPIKKPNKSVELAEFTGIMLGDGSIGKSQISITLHYKDDKAYGEFVVLLIKKLFDVYIGTYYDKKGSVMNYNVSRKELINFCIHKLGLKQGNKIKQKIDIPTWIKQNKQYAIACLRGLVDTDGCVFTHRYVVNGKLYTYKKLSFTSYSKPLRASVFNILKYNRFNPRLSQNRDVRLDSKKDIQRYFKIIGSHNPKHLQRYAN